MARRTAGGTSASVMTNPAWWPFALIMPEPLVMPQCARCRGAVSLRRTRFRHQVGGQDGAGCIVEASGAGRRTGGQGTVILSGSSSTPMTPVDAGSTWRWQLQHFANALTWPTPPPRPCGWRNAFSGVDQNGAGRSAGALQVAAAEPHRRRLERFWVNTARRSGKPLTIKARSSFSTWRMPA